MTPGARVCHIRRVAADHPAFAGHFPGRPVLPGVVLLAEVLEAVQAEPALRAAVGPRPTLSMAKFLAPVGPDSTLEIVLQLGPRALAFEVCCGGLPVARGQFALAEGG